MSCDELKHYEGQIASTSKPIEIKSIDDTKTELKDKLKNIEHILKKNDELL